MRQRYLFVVAFIIFLFFFLLGCAPVQRFGPIDVTVDNRHGIVEFELQDGRFITLDDSTVSPGTYRLANGMTLRIGKKGYPRQASVTPRPQHYIHGYWQ